MELKLIDLGVIDIIQEEEGTVIYTKLADFQQVKQWLESKQITCENAEVEYVARTKAGSLSLADLERLNQLVEALEDSDDVTTVYTNSGI